MSASVKLAADKPGSATTGQETSVVKVSAEPSQPDPEQSLLPCIVTVVPPDPAVITVVPGVYVFQVVPSILYRYESVQLTPPVPALKVAEGLAPAHICVPLAGVAEAKAGKAGSATTCKLAEVL